jgi:hypothetical protein
MFVVEPKKGQFLRDTRPSAELEEEFWDAVNTF